MNTPTAAFIGAGAIGLPMAIRAATVGKVIVVDPVIGRRRLADDAGIPAVAKVSEIPPAQTSIVMVATAPQAEQVILGEAGLAASMESSSVIILMSTIGPDAFRDIASKIPPNGPELIDAPVTGGVTGAVEGKLTIFVAGRPTSIEAVRPTLEAMGRVIEAGDSLGDGQSFKIVNQLLATSQLVVAAEALVFAENLGLDVAEVFEGVRGGAGQSWMLDTYGPRILTAPDDVSAALGIFHKDSTLVKLTAAQSGFRGPMLASAHTVFERASELGVVTEDASAIVDVVREMQSKPSLYSERTVGAGE